MVKTKEEKNQYIREWKRQRSIERGTFGQRGKYQHKTYTEEEFKTVLQHRKEWEKEWKTKYNKNKPEKRLLWSAKRRAKEKNLPFNIEEVDIVVPTVCPYLGITLERHAPRGTDRAKVCSLDRIIPELGYVKGNVEVISHLANTMKQHASRELLVNFAKAVLERYDK